MFKLVVLCAFIASAPANGLGFAPLAYSASVVAPATTTISRQASSVIHPSPLLYSTPLAYSSPLAYAHLIKKRSAPLALSTYVAPTTYLAPARLATTYHAAPLATTYHAAPLATTYHARPLATTYAASPLIASYAAPVYTTAAHFIKKRSAPLLFPSTYIAPTTYAAAPLLTSTYAAARPIISTPYYSAAPFAYTHLIKKRSAPLAVAAYTAPASFSHQSRLDIQHTPALNTYTTYSAPLAYASHLGYSHIY